MTLDNITKDELLNYVNDKLIQEGRPLDKGNMVITTYALASNNTYTIIREHDNINSVNNSLTLDNKDVFFVDYKILDEYISIVYIEVGFRNKLKFDYDYFGTIYKSNCYEKIGHCEYEDILRKDNIIKLISKL